MHLPTGFRSLAFGPLDLLILLAGLFLGWHLRRLYDGTVGRAKRAKDAITGAAKDNPVTRTGRTLFDKGKDLLDRARGKKPKDDKEKS